MNAPLQLPILSGETSWREAARLADLADICAPTLNLVYLPRALPQPLLADVTRQLPHGRGERRVVTAAADPCLDGLLFDGGASALHADWRFLIDVYATLTDAQSVGLRLHVLTGAMCPRFHTDRVGLRLICTYAGAGTEWLADEDVRRERLGHRADGLSDEHSGAVCGPVRRLPTGAIALLKGEAWPGHDGRGCVHRSPAAEDCTPRLIFTIDALADR
jgi:hypothetical protein